MRGAGGLLLDQPHPAPALVGYNKAAKLVERMEKEGVVGPPTSKAGGRREVLIQPI